MLALDRVIEEENGEPLVDLREAAPSLLIDRPQVIPYLRRSVAEMAERAARSLPNGFRFSVLEGWRPLARQTRIYDWHLAAAREAFPNRSEASLRRTVNRWVAPTNHMAPPGHCTGGAIDLALTDGSGEALDVCSPYSRFKASATYTIGLSAEAAMNRSLMLESMLAAGFSNCRDEYWHYSYGDAGWAVRNGVDRCSYGAVALPVALFEEQERLWVLSYQDRTNPFLSG